MLKQVFKVNRAYREAKTEVVEQSIELLEAKSTPWYAFVFISISAVLWLGAVLTPVGPVQLYEEFGFYPVPVIFVIFYFSIFLASKFIFKPTLEELTDDTSRFAVLSACKRREMRALVASGIALFLTVIFFLYLISKDPKLMELF